ncbi:hypothetical protein BB559_007330 [Furculomyces boomerangus]|uniref:Major facilitator superfamily (MFS) profile domain-containing protein n=2 Tax=Furculomyces boomerangus TaxID=61424 RepID=A0A2T9XXR5_9FUNG|nr:hypothetical protein BB559_007330 [Furculomyces boomerangus]
MKNRFLNYFASKPALVTLVSVSLLIDAAVYGIITPAIPTILQDEMKAPVSINGLLIGFYGLGVLIGAPSISYLSDRSGKRRMLMIVGFVVLGISSLGIGLSKHVYQIFLARLGQGIASGVTWCLGLACLIDIYPSDKLDSPISMAYSGFTLGIMGGPFIGDSEQLRLKLKENEKLYTNETNPTELKFTENNTEINVSTSNNIKGHEDGRGVEEHVEGNDVIFQGNGVEGNGVVVEGKAVEESRVIVEGKSVEGNGVIVEENGVVVEGNPKINFLDLLKEPRIMAACAVTTLVCGGLSALEVILPIYFSDKFSLNAEKIGYTFIAVSVPSIIGSLIFGRVIEMESMTRRFGPNKKRYYVIFAGNVLSGVFIMFLGLTKSIASSVVVMAIIGFCFGFGNVPVMAALGSHMSLMSEKRVAEGMTSSGGGGANSQVYSLYNIAYSIGVLVVPIIASVIYNSSGFLAINMILGAFMIVGTILSIGSVLMFSKGR